MNKLIVRDRGFYRNVLVLALPIALQSLITIGVNMLDNIMVGKIGATPEISECALSATSLGNTFISIYHIFCMGIGMGASVLVSRYWGMKEKEPEKATLALRKTVCIMLRITVALALLFAVATFLMPSRIMAMYTDELPSIERGAEYLRYSTVTYFFLGLSLVCTIVLRSVGQVRFPLFVSIGAFFVNLGANYVLIFGKLGFPRMEVAGAALGTLIARIYEASMICGYLFLKDKKIGFRLWHLCMKTRDLLGEYIRICIPVLISDGILAIGNSAVAIVIGHINDGGAFVAANSITSVVQQMSTVMIQGVSQAGAIVTGRTLGAGEKEKALRQGYGFFGLGLGLGLISALFIMVASGPIIQYYNLQESTKAITEQLMLAISFIIVFQATNSIMTKGVIRGGGDTRVLMVADNIFLWVLSIPLGIVAALVLEVPAFWIYTCLKADQIAKTIWCVIRLRSGKWIKKIGTGKVQG